MSITKAQALSLNYKDTIVQVKEFISTDETDNLLRARKWHINGKCETWKCDATRFQLPIKHGLYNYDHLTNENAHLFTLEG